MAFSARAFNSKSLSSSSNRGIKAIESFKTTSICHLVLSSFLIKHILTLVDLLIHKSSLVGNEFCQMPFTILTKEWKAMNLQGLVFCQILFFLYKCHATIIINKKSCEPIKYFNKLRKYKHPYLYAPSEIIEMFAHAQLWV